MVTLLGVFVQGSTMNVIPVTIESSLVSNFDFLNRYFVKIFKESDHA